VRVDLCLLPFSLKQLGLRSGLIIGPEFNVRVSHISERANIEYSPTSSDLPRSWGELRLCVSNVRPVNRPYSLSSGYSGNALKLGKSLDPVTCSAILEELTLAVHRFRVRTSHCAPTPCSGLPHGFRCRQRLPVHRCFFGRACHVMNNSATIVGRRVLRSSQCVLSIQDHQ
jgi:hypothetical protein